MKKSLVIIALALAVISCNKQSETEALKTAYVDTNKLLEEYTEAKDIDAKYKNKADEMGKELEAEAARFKADAAAFEQKARQLGQVWAQQNSGPLQQRQQQLQYAQQAMLQQLQQESGVEMDTLVKSIKTFIKDYGKKNGYDYIYGTGEAATVLYAEEKYDITDELIKELNSKYKPAAKKEDSAEAKSETPAEGKK
ncbi:MAG TPA: OmpH family outer membrane protein [Flavobacterium sp.]|jgi:outer membrane protein|nr:OmpH family outer membrane protein [Flavobacterium sp.]